jgi:putative transposase
MDGAARLTEHGSLAQGDRLNVTAATHLLGCRFVPGCLGEASIELDRQPLLLEKEIGETEVADLATPHSLHASEVQVLKGQSIKSNGKVVGGLPVPIISLIGSPAIKASKSETGRLARTAAFGLTGQTPSSQSDGSERTSERQWGDDLLARGKCEERSQTKVAACGVTRLWQRLRLRNIITGERNEISAGSFPANGHGFDVTDDFTGLMDAVDPALNPDSARSEYLPSRLLERETAVLPAGAERRRSLDRLLKKRIPRAIEPVRHRLNGLRIDSLPMKELRSPQPGKVRLQQSLFECFPVAAVVPLVASDRVIPDMRGGVDGPIKMPGPTRSHELKLEGLSHNGIISYIVSVVQAYKHNKTSVVLINYHFVWCPKRRRKVLVGSVERDLRKMIQAEVTKLRGEIVALEIMPDHVHLFFNSMPDLAPNEIMHQIKGSTSRALRLKYPHLARMVSLWTRSYFCSTAGNVSTDTVRRYIEKQKTR